jgi:hypothetical protein
VTSASRFLLILIFFADGVNADCAVMVSL